MVSLRDDMKNIPKGYLTYSLFTITSYLNYTWRYSNGIQKHDHHPEDRLPHEGRPARP